MTSQKLENLLNLALNSAEDEREKYRQYRHYLRDIPETPGFPDVSVFSFAEWRKNI